MWGYILMATEKVRKKRKFKWSFLFILCGILYFVFAIVGQQSQLNKLNNQIVAEQEKIAQKNQEIETLNDEQAMRESDEYIEKLAREMGLVRSDESVIVDVTGK